MTCTKNTFGPYNSACRCRVCWRQPHRCKHTNSALECMQSKLQTLCKVTFAAIFKPFHYHSGWITSQFLNSASVLYNVTSNGPVAFGDSQPDERNKKSPIMISCSRAFNPKHNAYLCGVKHVLCGKPGFRLAPLWMDSHWRVLERPVWWGDSRSFSNAVAERRSFAGNDLRWAIDWPGIEPLLIDWRDSTGLVVGDIVEFRFCKDQAAFVLVGKGNRAKRW